MVSREDEDVLVVADLEQHSSQKQARREIELPLSFCSDLTLNLSVPLSPCQRTQICKM